MTERNIEDKNLAIRLARVEERLQNLETSVGDLRKEVANISKKLDDTLPRFFKEMKDFLDTVAGRYAQREWVEKVDSRVKDLEMWKSRTDPNNDLGSRLDQLDKKISVGIAIITVLGPVLYFLIQSWLSKFI
jgi:archaellum component FlaC